jgi:hypothetical protein
MSKLARSTIRGCWSRLFTVALIAVSAMLSTTGAHAVRPETTASAATISTTPLLPDAVASRIAEYAEGGAGDVTRALVTLGFTDAGTIATREALSAQALLQWAYSAAELGEKNAGKPFLSAFITAVAKNVPSILEERMVRKFLGRHPPERSSFEFATLTKSPAASHDPEVARLIAVVAEVTASRGSGISPRSIMERKLGLKEKDVMAALLRFGSGKAALEDQLARLPNPPQKSKLAEIAREIFATIPAARADKTLAEAIFRWTGLNDPKFGEWFRYRDKMIDIVEAGKLNVSEEKQAAAKSAVLNIRADMATMASLYSQKGLALNAQSIERMFSEYAIRNPEAAALWGFAVIAMKEDFDFDRYIPEAVQSLRNRIREAQAKGATITGVPITNEKFVAIIKEHGPKPYQGFAEYVRLTGFLSERSAAEYFSSERVEHAVNGICPGGPGG